MITLLQQALHILNLEILIQITAYDSLRSWHYSINDMLVHHHIFQFYATWLYYVAFQNV